MQIALNEFVQLILLTIFDSSKLNVLTRSSGTEKARLAFEYLPVKTQQLLALKNSSRVNSDPPVSLEIVGAE